jgi:polyisoprenoid-binding protein YceI
MIPRILCLFLALALGWARAAERPLAIDSTQSRIDIVVRATMGSFTGKLASFNAAVGVAEDGRVVSARLPFRFLDIATGKDDRDKAMHKWQETEKFPDGVFELTSLEPATAPESGFVAVGRLTFHGVTRDLRFPASVIRDAGNYAIDGDATIDTREFGLPIIRMMGLLKVDPLVHVRFHLQGSATP